jgi:hypothetical protein
VSPTNKKRYRSLPTARVSFEDGDKLLTKGAKLVHLVTKAEDGHAKSWNIIAELKSSIYPEEIIVVGGHYDTVLEVSGA